MAGQALAGSQRIDIPAGSLRTAITQLSAQASVSIAVEDEDLWRRKVPAVRGTLTPEAALRRLLRGSNARIAAAGPRAWRVSVGKAPLARGAAPRSSRPAPPTDDELTIVVTASKRDTRLKDFAGSVSIIDGMDLLVGGERGMESIVTRLAGLSSTYLGAGRNKLFIRGIADSSFTGPTQATVGQYLGDIRLTYNAPDPDLRLYDIRSVEVLEGPQGTLYGAGSLGGIIRLEPNQARLNETSAMLSSGVSATQHGAPGGDLGGTINLPLGRDAAFRMVGYGIREGGYIDDVLRMKHDVNRTSIFGGRASIHVDAGDSWTIDASALLQDTDGDDSQYADRDLPPLKRASATAGKFDAHYALADLVIGKTWDGLAFKSSVGAVQQHLDERYDASPPEGPGGVFAQRNRTAMITTESRLWRPLSDGFGWVLGGSFTHNRTSLGRSLGPLGIPEPRTGVVNTISETTTYGEMSFQPNAVITLTAGARYSHASLAGTAKGVEPEVKVDLNKMGVTARRSQDTLLPSGAISARIAPHGLVFLRYQEGARPGGLAIEDLTVRRFDRDRVRSVETGIRFGQDMAGAVSGAVSASYARWTDIQADFIDGGGLPSTSNVGTGRIYSVSASFRVRPTGSLAVDAAATFNNSLVTKPSAAFLQSLLNVRASSGGQPPVEGDLIGLGHIPNVASFTGRLGFRYTAVVGNDVGLQIEGWTRYVGKSRLGVGPVLGGKQGQYLDSGLSARFAWPGASGITFSINNIFDVVGNRFAFGTPFAEEARQLTPLRPRTIRVGFDRAF